jgi:hypothetical protein
MSVADVSAARQVKTQQTTAKYTVLRNSFTDLSLCVWSPRRAMCIAHARQG